MKLHYNITYTASFLLPQLLRTTPTGSWQDLTESWESRLLQLGRKLLFTGRVSDSGKGSPPRGAFSVIIVLVSLKKCVTVTPNTLYISMLGVTLVFDVITE